MEVVASLSQGRTAAAQCGLFTYKSVPVIFEPPCNCVPSFQWFFHLPAFLIFNTILCCDTTLVRGSPFVTMPTNYFVPCTFKGTLFCFVFVTGLVVHIILQICCVSSIAVLFVTWHLSLFFRPIMVVYTLKFLCSV